MRAEFKVDGAKLTGSMNDLKIEGTFENESWSSMVLTQTAK